MKIDFILYGIKRGDGRFDINFKKLRDLLKIDFEINTIEIVNNIELIHNRRSEEFGIAQNKRQVFRDSRFISKSYEKDLEYAEKVKLIEKFPDVHLDAYRSTRNLIQQLLMLRDALNLSENKIIFTIRDDIIFDPAKLFFAIKKFLTICSHEKSFLTSFFHGNTGLSERFMLTQNPGSSIILGRFEEIEDYLLGKSEKKYCHSAGLNGEWLARFVSDKYQLVPICAPIFTKRIRSHGVHNEKIFSSPHRWVHELDNMRGLEKFLIGKDK